MNTEHKVDTGKVKNYKINTSGKSVLSAYSELIIGCHLIYAVKIIFQEKVIKV